MQLFPATAVIPTRHRPRVLARTLDSIATQSFVPAEIVIVDASEDSQSRDVVAESKARFSGQVAVLWQQARTVGAAAQRNQAFTLASQGAILFIDDDVVLEPGCLERLWRALAADKELGGVNGMITNQSYRQPGKFSRMVFTILNGGPEASFAGRVLGPAVNLLPENADHLPEVVHVEWLNTTCTLYRREALGAPPFDSNFTGYSLMEDLALSLKVGRTWRLANVRTARLFHDSQPGSHKSDVAEISCMELVNRHYVMTAVLGRRRFSDYVRLVLWEFLQIAYAARQYGIGRGFWRFTRGKWSGLARIVA